MSQTRIDDTMAHPNEKNTRQCIIDSTPFTQQLKHPDATLEAL